MKIVHIQTSMAPAGNAAYRLSTAMRNCGIDSYVFNLSCRIKREHVYNRRKGVITLLRRFIDKIVCNYRLRGKSETSYFYHALPVIGSDIAQNPLINSADVIYLHWVAKYLSIDNIEKIAMLGKPVIIFMHDMWAFTGGCHHSFDCYGFTHSCNNCRMFKFNNPAVDEHLNQKKRLYEKYPNICFVSPSKWMTGLACSSHALKNKSVFTIPNVVDETVFKPLGKAYARKLLNLPEDKVIITFGYQIGPNNPYKGWAFLEKAVNKICCDNILIVIFGSHRNPEIEDKVKYPMRFLGPIYDETTLSLICNAADLCVNPSLCESFSLVCLENILCGTPVVAFDTTALPELVKTGETGYLAKFRDVDDLARGIETVIRSKPNMTYRDSYSSKSIVDAHIKIIRQMDKSRHNVIT